MPEEHEWPTADSDGDEPGDQQPATEHDSESDATDSGGDDDAERDAGRDHEPDEDPAEPAAAEDPTTPGAPLPEPEDAQPESAASGGAVPDDAEPDAAAADAAVADAAVADDAEPGSLEAEHVQPESSVQPDDAQWAGSEEVQPGSTQPGEADTAVTWPAEPEPDSADSAAPDEQDTVGHWPVEDSEPATAEYEPVSGGELDPDATEVTTVGEVPVTGAADASTTMSMPLVAPEITQAMPAVPERVEPAGAGDQEATTTFHAVTDGSTDALTPVIAPVAVDSARTAHHESGGDATDGTAGFAPGFAAGGAAGGAGDDGGGGSAGGRRRWLRRPLLVAGSVLGVLALVYGADLLLSAGDVPRGVTVAGVSVGGMSEEAAESKLQDELRPRTSEPVAITAGDMEAELAPQAAGLGVDWQGTLEQVGRQPLNPITRVTSFFTTREIGVVGDADEERLVSALDELASEQLHREKEEGGIEFEPVPGSDGDVEAVAVEPVPGQQLTNIESAADTVRRSWLDRDGVDLEVEVEPVEVDAEAVQETLRSVAEPAVSGPITFRGEGDDAQLRPAEIGEVLTFTPGEGGSLEAEVDNEALEDALQSQLADTEDEGRDAEIVFSGGEPTVEPSEEGRVIDWEPTLEPFMDVVVRPEGREIDVTYTDDKPEVTTEEAEALGIDEVIGEFTTEDFAKDSGVNIRRVAQQVDGAIVKPGETFSLNQHTGPRTESQGYVDAGIIEDGVPGRAVGGGISQFATTLYNAAYFAGLQDAGHSPHSYYISRYPVAREATVYQAAGGGGIDLAFTNDAETGVAIQTNWTPSSVTVRIWGTKRYDVDSVTSDRTDVVEPSERRVDDPDCEPSSGIEGFKATDTRILRDPDTGEVVRRESDTVTYNPKPKIICTDDESD